MAGEEFVNRRPGIADLIEPEPLNHEGQRQAPRYGHKEEQHGVDNDAPSLPGAGRAARRGGIPFGGGSQRLR
jgi:hypothetical protein